MPSEMTDEDYIGRLHTMIMIMICKYGTDRTVELNDADRERFNALGSGATMHFEDLGDTIRVKCVSQAEYFALTEREPNAAQH